MKNYKTLIKSEAEKMQSLHEAIHATFLDRGKDSTTWHDACEAFHSYVSEIDLIIERAYEETEYSDEELLEFVISFLEVDPVFFRSGYIKE